MSASINVTVSGATAFETTDFFKCKECGHCSAKADLVACPGPHPHVHVHESPAEREPPFCVCCGFVCGASDTDEPATPVVVDAAVADEVVAQAVTPSSDDEACCGCVGGAP